MIRPRTRDIGSIVVKVAGLGSRDNKLRRGTIIYGGCERHLTR